LHDLGKIGVPDFVLHKQSKLSDEEFAVIKAHPEIGAKILKAVKSFRDLVPAIYCHHERFDGRGYPRGVRGEHIPIHGPPLVPKGIILPIQNQHITDGKSREAAHAAI
jgi:HD-GYP domain-containing protein (c-di-GMP phosphodiesterase class II)